MKYYLLSLAQLSSTLDENVKKKNIEETTLQFLSQHDYFSKIWVALNEKKRQKILDIIISRKGINPNEKINSMESLN